MADSKGDPRVVFVMNLVLSSVFATVLVSALSFVGVMTFAWDSMALTAAALMLVTYIVVE